MNFFTWVAEKLIEWHDERRELAWHKFEEFQMQMDEDPIESDSDPQPEASEGQIDKKSYPTPPNALNSLARK